MSQRTTRPEQPVDRRRLLIAGGAASAAALAGLTRPAAAAAEGEFAAYATAGTFTKPQAIRPDADETALTLQAGGTGQTPILAVQDRAGQDLMRVANGNYGRVSFPKTGEGHGALTLDVSAPVFAGTRDPILYLGYNHAGAPILAGEPSIGIGFEGDYNDGSKRTLEIYAEAFAENAATALRPWFFQFRRDATTKADFMTWSEIMGNPLRIIDTAGTAIAHLGANAVSFYSRGVFRQRPEDSGDALQIQAANGAVNTRVTPDGAIVAQRIGIRRTPSVNFDSYSPNASDVAYAVRADGDGPARHFVTAAGEHRWGPGNAAADTSLFRSAAKQLKAGQQLIAADGVATRDVNATGLSSAQIDALFTTTPPDGMVVSDSANRTLLVRQRGRWYATGALKAV